MGRALASDTHSEFSQWEQAHAIFSVTGVACSVLLAASWPLAFAALTSFAWLLLSKRGHHCARGGFGIANGITSLRLVLTLALMLAASAAPGWLLATTVVSIIVLDGIDGHIARRRGEATPFGAHFDVEVDAMMVMALSCVLLLRDLAGAWVLLAGLWRYIYLATVHVIVPPNPERSRTRLARAIYVLMTTCFAVALIVPPAWAPRLAALGTLSVSFSFGVSFWDRYAASRHSPPST